MPMISLFLHRHQDTENYHLRPSHNNFQVFAFKYIFPSDLDWIESTEQFSFNKTLTNRVSTLNQFSCFLENNFKHFDLIFNVGNNETVEETGGIVSFQTMTDLFQYFSYIIKQDLEKYKCLMYNVTIIVTSDIHETPEQPNTVCGNRLPSFDDSKNLVRVIIKIRSEYSNDRQTLQCSNDNPVFLFDSASAVKLTFTNIQLEKMMIRPLNITNSILINSVIYIHLSAHEAGISDSKLIRTQTKISEVGTLKLRNTTMLSGALYITDCGRIHMDSFYFHDSLEHTSDSTLKVSNSETFHVSRSTFVFGKYSSLQIEAVIEAIFLTCQFDYMTYSSKDDGPTEYGIVGNLLFRLYLIGCTLKNRNHDHGWLKIISGGVINIENVIVANNTCNKAEGIFYFYLCQTIYMSDSTFTSNSAKHSGSLLLLSSKTFNISNTQFIDNHSLKSGGALSVLESYGSSQLRKVSFIRNVANNGNGGAIAMVNSKGYITISNVTFSHNRATLGGGALYANNVTFLFISQSNFENNIAHHETNDERCVTTSFLSGGSGGGISLFQSAFELLESNFTENKATRGGAIFTTSSALIQDTQFVNNKAFVAGGACFFVLNSSQITLFDVVMQNNEANIYGQNISTPVYSFSKEILKPIPTNGHVMLYPGETLALKFTNMYDKNNNYIPIMYECPFPSISDRRFYLLSNISNFESNTIYFTLMIQPNVDVDLEKHLIEADITICFTESQNSSLRVFIGPCPTDYVINDGKCEMSFPLSKVIPGIVVGSILLLFFGIILGSCVCSFCAFSVWRIFKKAKSLYVRQRSEREIEEKLLNYDVSFSHYGSLNSGESSTMEKNLQYIIPVSDLKIEKKIGEGASGSVYKAKYNMMDVAVKTIIRKDDTHQDFEKEVMLLVKLRHPNIICFYGICISESQLCIVVELCQNGSLEQMIKEMKKGKIKKKFKDKLKILIGVANGMKYLHGLQPHYLIHRDLKPANIILDQSYTPKVCDFGLSRVVSMNTQTNSFTGNVGTMLYMSPELILEEDSETNKLTRENATKIDVYSYAIIMYELFFEETPYWNEDNEKINFFQHCNSDQKKVKAFNLLYQVANHEKRPLIPFINHEEMKLWCEKFMPNDNVSNEDLLIGVDMYVKLMKQCWSANPIERPSFERIIQKLTEIYQMLS
ncbi:hypothetical protein FDP41_010393 [Naegleria fowleri]|uniref:Protein kinase domain-containing protein n=1 Tax=Naegleria fowleri TaxID=5763 RepID=A0A6A5CCR8_NAEFO|nr:uncharacterized protein FDP41_010393 [Naegleria fowleri]KAF0983328.1 hypothetical protein FDP41_010393 [Naegleria fowleri]